MRQPGEKVQNELERIKTNVEKAYQFSAPNYRRFSYSRRFLYKSTLNDTDYAYLSATQKPQVAFNIGEAYISRLRGEFADQIPDIEVGSNDSSQISVQTIDNIEGHIRHIFCDKALLPNSIYEEQLSGGFSVMKIYTDYENEMAFEQCIKIMKCYDPTLVGFDPMAVEPSKSDGNFCFECFPKTIEDFKRENPEVDISNLEFAKSSFGAFSWSYRGGKEDILLLVDYYEKKRKKVRLLQLANGKVLLEKQYEKYLEQWNAAQHIEQPAAVIKERWTTKTVIVRYRLIEDKIIEQKETDYEDLPLIYVPGNAQRIKDDNSENVEEIARPYLYHAQDAIRLKNFAGQCLANELENMIQHKIIASKESIPDEQDYRAAYTNIQAPSNYIYNAFYQGDPNIPLQPPQPVVRPPIPQEIMLAFTTADQTVQALLGSYDAALGVNGNDVSGKAIVEGATHSNAAAMPYVMGYLSALEQAAKVVVNLIPKYFKTPRTIPIIDDEGKRSFIKIGESDMQYQSNALNVKVRAGANFSVQKNRALQQVIALSKASQQFAAFFNEKGLPVILDNLEIRGIEKLKDMAREWQKEQEQMRKQAQSQPNPEMIKAQAIMQKLQLDAAKLQKEMQEMHQEWTLRNRQLSADEEKTQNETMRILLDAHEAGQNSVVQMAKTATEREVSQHELEMRKLSQHHDHAHDKARLAHEILESERKHRRKEELNQAQQF